MSAIYFAVSGNNSLSGYKFIGHAKLVLSVSHKGTDFIEGTGIDEHIDPLTCMGLAFVSTLRQGLFSAHFQDGLASLHIVIIDTVKFTHYRPP
jgi:hypothetical protein